MVLDSCMNLQLDSGSGHWMSTLRGWKWHLYAKQQRMIWVWAAAALMCYTICVLVCGSWHVYACVARLCFG
jgi:hypothetical protein